MESPLIRLIFQ